MLNMFDNRPLKVLSVTTRPAPDGPVRTTIFPALTAVLGSNSSGPYRLTLRDVITTSSVPALVRAVALGPVRRLSL